MDLCPIGLDRMLCSDEFKRCVSKRQGCAISDIYYLHAACPQAIARHLGIALPCLGGHHDRRKMKCLAQHFACAGVQIKGRLHLR